MIIITEVELVYEEVLKLLGGPYKAAYMTDQEIERAIRKALFKGQISLRFYEKWQAIIQDAVLLGSFKDHLSDYFL